MAPLEGPTATVLHVHGMPPAPPVFTGFQNEALADVNFFLRVSYPIVFLLCAPGASGTLTVASILGSFYLRT